MGSGNHGRTVGNAEFDALVSAAIKQHEHEPGSGAGLVPIVKVRADVRAATGMSRQAFDRRLLDAVERHRNDGGDTTFNLEMDEELAGRRGEKAGVQRVINTRGDKEWAHFIAEYPRGNTTSMAGLRSRADLYNSAPKPAAEKPAGAKAAPKTPKARSTGKGSRTAKVAPKTYTLAQAATPTRMRALNEADKAYLAAIFHLTEVEGQQARGAYVNGQKVMRADVREAAAAREAARQALETAANAFFEQYGINALDAMRYAGEKAQAARQTRNAARRSKTAN